TTTDFAGSNISTTLDVGANASLTSTNGDVSLTADALVRKFADFKLDQFTLADAPEEDIASFQATSSAKVTFPAPSGQSTAPSTRSSGSRWDDKFQVGQVVETPNATDTNNNGRFTITQLSPTVMTLAQGDVIEASADDATATLKGKAVKAAPLLSLDP